jgi:hypothetical protein
MMCAPNLFALTTRDHCAARASLNNFLHYVATQVLYECICLSPRSPACNMPTGCAISSFNDIHALVVLLQDMGFSLFD